MEAFENFISLLSGLIWGGAWGDTRIVPIMGPIAWVLLGAGLFFMIRLGGRPLARAFPCFRRGLGRPQR